jgi:hypothetical protein
MASAEIIGRLLLSAVIAYGGCTRTIDAKVVVIAALCKNRNARAVSRAGIDRSRFLKRLGDQARLKTRSGRKPDRQLVWIQFPNPYA